MGPELMRHSTAHYFLAAAHRFVSRRRQARPSRTAYHDIELPEGATVSPDDFAAIEAHA